MTQTDLVALQERSVWQGKVLVVGTIAVSEHAGIVHDQQVHDMNVSICEVIEGRLHFCLLESGDVSLPSQGIEPCHLLLPLPASPSTNLGERQGVCNWFYYNWERQLHGVQCALLGIVHRMLTQQLKVTRILGMWRVSVRLNSSYVVFQILAHTQWLIEYVKRYTYWWGVLNFKRKSMS